MSMQDPIADMFTRIRHAQAVGHPTVSIPASKLKTQIANLLEREGFVKGYKESVEDSRKVLIVELKYFEGKPSIVELSRFSKPSLRAYTSVKKIPKIRDGLGVAIISSVKGVISDKQAREFNVGGEVIGTVF